MAPGVTILDNGGETIKCGNSLQKAEPRVIPNCIIKTKAEKVPYIADLTSNITDHNSLFYRRPIDRGLICNFEVQKTIWDRIFNKAVLDVRPVESSLMITMTPFTPRDVQRTLMDMIFEDYSFASLCAVNPSLMGWYGIKQEESNLSSAPGGVVIDSGYSFTHVTPVFDDSVLNYAVKRVNIGGKALTNHLKQLVSYRAWNMMDETYVVNEVKERLCYISQDFLEDMKKTKLPDGENPIRKEYMLPDYVSLYKGYVKGEEDDPEVQKNSGDPSKKRKLGASDEQVLVVNNERIAVPEILFNPSDIGLEQMGIAEACVEAINCCNPDIRPLLYRNIVLQGGNVNMPGFKERVESEIRKLAPDMYEVCVYASKEPTSIVYKGMAHFARQQDYPKYCVTKGEFHDHGFELCESRFYTANIGN